MQCAFNPMQIGVMTVADDVTPVHSYSTLLQWWQHLSSNGPDFGILEIDKKETVFYSQLANLTSFWYCSTYLSTSSSVAWLSGLNVQYLHHVMSFFTVGQVRSQHPPTNRGAMY